MEMIRDLWRNQQNVQLKLIKMICAIIREKLYLEDDKSVLFLRNIFEPKINVGLLILELRRVLLAI